MRSEGAIENEAASGELLDTAKVNSTATAGGAGWEERTFAGTMSWEAVDAVVKTCEDGVLEYTPLHGASCSLSSALDRVCIRTRELADRAQDMRGGGDSEAD